MFLRFGITNLPFPKDKQKCVERQFIAFELLGNISGTTDLDEEILQRIARTMPAGERNIRLTFAGRRTDVDAAIASLISHQFSQNAPVRIHDVAASNAVTSLDLYRQLEGMTNVTLLASDLHGYISIANAGPVQVVFDDQNRWIQFVWGRLVLNRRLTRKDRYLVNFLLTKILTQIVVPIALRKPNHSTVSLFHPRALAVAAQTDRFKLEQRDLLELPNEEWHVVRVMSVLFNWPDDLRNQALLTLARSVQNGGFFVIGTGNTSPRQSIANCSIFQRCGASMKHVCNVGPPAIELEAVLALRL